MQRQTEVVNVRVAYIRPLGYDNLKQWMADPNNVYIGRGGVLVIDGQRWPPSDSIWANPFKPDRDGTREEVIVKYRQHILDLVTAGRITKETIESLKGKRLGCWCKPDACHGDFVLRLVNECV